MGTKRIALLLALGILGASFLILGGSLLIAQIVQTQSAEHIYSNEDLLKIGIRYVEETYGTDYAINGQIANSTYELTGPNESIELEYPAASFRVPADYQKPGIIIYVMINPQSGEIAKVWIATTKSLPPEFPSNTPPS